MSEKTAGTGGRETSERALSNLEAHVLYVVRRDGEIGLTYDEITASLAGDGYDKKAGYIRRVVKALEDRQLLERSLKPGKKKLSLTFAIPKDGVNSRRITSLILLELMRVEREDEEVPERGDFVQHILQLKFIKKSGKALSEPDITKAIKFCETHSYIEKTEGDTIRAADRTKHELPFIKLVAHGDTAAAEIKPQRKKAISLKKKKGPQAVRKSSRSFKAK
jgi:hypothetical protein